MEEKEIKRKMKIRYHSMKARCLNKNCPAYLSYGKRGIKICPRWLKSFNNFYEDMKDGFNPDYQLHRVDEYGGYSPENCKWVTADENARAQKRLPSLKGTTLVSIHNRTYKNYVMPIFQKSDTFSYSRFFDKIFLDEEIRELIIKKLT